LDRRLGGPQGLYGRGDEEKKIPKQKMVKSCQQDTQNNSLTINLSEDGNLGDREGDY